MTIREQISEYNPEAILFDDLNDAVIGVGQQHGSQTVAIYDKEKCIDIFYRNFLEAKREQLGRILTAEERIDLFTEAVEWFEYNVECAYAGENTPIFVERFEDAC